MSVSITEQLKIISKGAAVITNEINLVEKLKLNRPLNIKLGLDPSAPDIHLGHAVVLRKMRQLQDLGHNAVIIIGDFTGRIGDPTGKSKTRNALTEEEVKHNADTYKKQIFKILDPEKTEVRFNSEWLSKLSFEDVIQLSSRVTVARMLERDDFHNRFNSNIPIGLHEFFYPIMQAYDSVEINADIELGGTDQTFNIYMGRTLQKSMGRDQQVALLMPILTGLDGVEKMSKSLGNYIGVNEDARVMFKKVMEIPDKDIITYFELATDEHPERICAIERDMKNGKNPRDIKIELATIITGLYHNKETTLEAIEYYRCAFSKKEIPKNVPELVIDWENDRFVDIIPLLVKENYAKSNSELRRMLLQGGIQKDGEKLDDINEVLICGDILKIGKKQFVKIIK